MKFTSLLKSVILEQSRFEVLFNALTKPSKDKEGIKSKPKLTKQEFIQLVTADPTTRLNNIDVETADSKELEKVKHDIYISKLIYSYHDCDSYEDIFRDNIPFLENKMDGILYAIKNLNKSDSSSDSSSE